MEREKKTNIYKECRLNKGFRSVSAAINNGFIPSGKDWITDDILQRIESGDRKARPEDVVAMAEVYESDILYNNYCSHECEIGKKVQPMIGVETDMKTIALETIKSVNHLYELKDRMVEIVVDDKIDETEEEEFNLIRKYLEELEEISVSLRLLLDKKKK